MKLMTDDIRRASGRAGLASKRSISRKLGMIFPWGSRCGNSSRRSRWRTVSSPRTCSILLRIIVDVIDLIIGGVGQIKFPQSVIAHHAAGVAPALRRQMDRAARLPRR